MRFWWIFRQTLSRICAHLMKICMPMQSSCSTTKSGPFRWRPSKSQKSDDFWDFVINQHGNMDLQNRHHISEITITKIIKSSKISQNLWQSNMETWTYNRHHISDHHKNEIWNLRFFQDKPQEKNTSSSRSCLCFACFAHQILASPRWTPVQKSWDFDTRHKNGQNLMILTFWTDENEIFERSLIKNLITSHDAGTLCPIKNVRVFRKFHNFMKSFTNGL